MTTSEFYDRFKGDNSLEKVNEALYIIIHTVYLEDEVNYKLEIMKNWKRKLGEGYLPDSFWKYIIMQYKSFADVKLVEPLKSGIPFSSESTVIFTLLHFEMDLKLVECALQGKQFQKNEFREYIYEKYSQACCTYLNRVEEYEIQYIKDFGALGRALLPYKEKIQNIYEKFWRANEATLENFKNPNAKFQQKETADTIAAAAEPKKIASTEETLKDSTDVTDYKKIIKNLEEKLHASQDYEIVMSGLEDKVRRLERDISEYRRQRDEAREYSAKEYERGIKTLFGSLNDARHSKIVDYFYKLMSEKDIDDNLRSYLENFFMALAECEITPILQGVEIGNIPENKLTADYNLDFDKSDYDADKTQVKYVGWKYKNTILEKPTLTKK